MRGKYVKNKRVEYYVVVVTCVNFFPKVKINIVDYRLKRKEKRSLFIFDQVVKTNHIYAGQ